MSNFKLSSLFLNRLQQVDIHLLKWIYQRPFKHSLFVKALIFIGDGPSWMLVVFFSALLAQASLFLDLPFLSTESINNFSMLANLLMFGLIIGNVIFVPMKENIQRRRPYANPELQEKLNLEIINRDPGHGSKELESFPSGHAMWTTLCVGIICSLFGWPGIVFVGWLIPAMVLLRPYLGVHYPSDALLGFLIGAVIAAIVILLTPLVAEGELYLQQRIGGFYLLGYWCFIAFFLYKGMKSWLRRV